MVLNLVFVLLFHMDVAGVALATVIADGVGAGLLWHYLRRETGPIRVEPALLRLDRKLLRGILYIGIPAAIQGMMFNIANVIIQSGINRLGSDVVAASTIGVTAEIFVYYLLNSFGQASMTFNGQNYGAGNLRRCRSATRWCLLLGGILSEAFALLLVVFGLPFAGIYTSDAGIALLALTRMRWVLPFQLFNMVIEVMSGTLRGLGYSFVPTILCAVFVCGLRILWVAFVFPLMPTFQGLLLVYPASWLAGRGSGNCGLLGAEAKAADGKTAPGSGGALTKKDQEPTKGCPGPLGFLFQEFPPQGFDDAAYRFLLTFREIINVEGGTVLHAQDIVNGGPVEQRQILQNVNAGRGDVSLIRTDRGAVHPQPVGDCFLR